MFLTVEPNPDVEGEWRVLPHYPRFSTPPAALRSFPSRAAAWHMACWYGHEQANTLPKITDGDHFIPDDGAKGYTSDPRRVVTVPAESVDSETYGRIKGAITRFIRARIGEMSEWEPLGVPPAEDLPEQPAGEPESEPESPAAVEPTPVHWTQIEDVRDAMTDSQRNAYDNFLGLVESNTGAARDYWQAKVDQLIEESAGDDMR